MERERGIGMESMCAERRRNRLSSRKGSVCGEGETRRKGAFAYDRDKTGIGGYMLREKERQKVQDDVM